MEATSVTSVVSHFKTNASEMNTSFALGSPEISDEGIFGVSMGPPLSPWPCDHIGPLVMKEKYPLPMLVDAARTLDSYEIVQIVAFASVFAVSVCGNLVVMIVVYLNSFLRSTINYYLVSLAVSDLLITILCWPTITTQLTQPFYILGRPLCKINVLTQTTCVTASVMTLSAVACDRVYAVMLPLRARSSAARPLTLIVAIWVVAVFLAIPAFLVRDVQVFQWDDLTEESCSDILPRCNQNASIVFKYYRILLTLMLFFLPAVVMVLAYAVILLRLWCVKRPAMPTPSTSNAPPNPHIRAKRKIVKMTAMVLLAFLVCWCPLHILLFYDLISQQPLPPWFDRFVFWAYFLGYCNSALNPLLYGGFSDNFRLGFKNLFRPRRSTSDHMQLPSTAMATSISVNRGSSRLSFARKSSLFHTFSNPLTPSAAITLLQKNNNGVSRCRSGSTSQRSSVYRNSFSQQSSSGKCPSYQNTDSIMPCPERDTNGTHDTSSVSLSLPSDPCESLLGTPVAKLHSNSECHSKDERKALLSETLGDRNDVNDSLANSSCSYSSGGPRPLESQLQTLHKRQSQRIDNFTSIEEEGYIPSDKDQTTENNCRVNGTDFRLGM